MYFDNTMNFPGKYQDWIESRCDEHVNKLIPLVTSLFSTHSAHSQNLLLFSCSIISDSLWPHGLHAAYQGPLSFTFSWSLLKLMSIELEMASNTLVLCCSLLLLPSTFTSIRVFCNELALRIRWPKYWSFSFSISLFNEYSGLISFRIDWFDLLAVQGTLKSLLQYHSLKASILQCSAFFIIQFLHPNMTTGKTIALTMATPFTLDEVLCLINISWLNSLIGPSLLTLSLSLGNKL